MRGNAYLASLGRTWTLINDAITNFCLPIAKIFFSEQLESISDTAPHFGFTFIYTLFSILPFKKSNARLPKKNMRYLWDGLKKSNMLCYHCVPRVHSFTLDRANDIAWEWYHKSLLRLEGVRFVGFISVLKP